MKQRGLTLIELLLATALLALVAIAVAGLIEMAGRAAPDKAAIASDRRAAETALALVVEDLWCGDFGSDRPIGVGQPRVSLVGSGELRIQTRERGEGAVTHRYLLQPGTDRLVRQTADAQDQAVRDARPLMEGVRDFSALMMEDEPTVRITITLATGGEVSRRVSPP